MMGFQEDVIKSTGPMGFQEDVIKSTGLMDFQEEDVIKSTGHEPVSSFCTDQQLELQFGSQKEVYIQNLP